MIFVTRVIFSSVRLLSGGDRSDEHFGLLMLRLDYAEHSSGFQDLAAFRFILLIPLTKALDRPAIFLLFLALAAIPFLLAMYDWLVTIITSETVIFLMGFYLKTKHLRLHQDLST
jgi:hypothetical protein